MIRIVVIAHNIRSIHNVGSIFRTCEGFGVEQLILSGYTPYPELQCDPRLPHIAKKLSKEIEKTALGAEKTVPFIHTDTPPLDQLKNDGYSLIGLEQDTRSVPLQSFTASSDIALLIGEEVAGLDVNLRSACETLLEIPMYGTKESFNVSVATGIALYQLRI